MSVNTSFQISTADVGRRQKLDLRPGMTVRVFQKIQEKGKTRLQAYEGLVIARKHNLEPGATFTVRKVASGVGMEKTFPLYSPNIDKIEILKASKVRQSKLYYIRDKSAKEIRRKMKGLDVELVSEQDIPATEPEVTEEEVVAEEATETTVEEAGEEKAEEIPTEEVKEEDLPAEAKAEEGKQAA